MEDIFYFIILCFYLHYRHLCFNTNVFFICFVFWSSWLLFFLSFVYPEYYIKDHIYCWEVFCSLGMKDMMFQRRQDSNRMLWSVRNAEFAERGNWRLGRDGEDRKKLWLLMSLPLHRTQSENKSCPIKDLLVLSSPSGSSFTIELKKWVHAVVFLFGFFFLYLIIIVCVCLHFYKILTKIYYLWNIIIYNISVFYLF